MTSNPSFPLLNPATAKSTIIDARPVSPTTFFEVVVVIEAVDDDAECDDATRESKSAALMSSGAASGSIVSASFLRLKRDIISRDQSSSVKLLCKSVKTMISLSLCLSFPVRRTSSLTKQKKEKKFSMAALDFNLDFGLVN
jgi:hypothetical protein